MKNPHKVWKLSKKSQVCVSGYQENSQSFLKSKDEKPGILKPRDLKSRDLTSRDYFQEPKCTYCTLHCLLKSANVISVCVPKNELMCERFYYQSVNISALFDAQISTGSNIFQYERLGHSGHQKKCCNKRMKKSLMKKTVGGLF